MVVVASGVLKAAKDAARRLLALDNNASALLREVGIDPDDAATVFDGFPETIDARSALATGLVIGAMAERQPPSGRDR